MNINSQSDAIKLFIETLNRVENIDQQNPLIPHVFAVYRAYCNMDANIRKEHSFTEFVESLALDIEERITTLEGLTNYKVPNKAASVCPIIPGLTVSKAAIFLLGLMPAASKYRRDCKTAVRKGTAKL